MKNWELDEPIITIGKLSLKIGTNGEEYYILEKGELEVLVFDETGTNVKFTKKLNEREGFGELALIYNCPRTASIIVS